MLDWFFHALGYGLCHQLPERSYFAGGYQLPVCARDTGIYLGFALGILVLWALARRTRPTELPQWPVLVLIGLFVGSMAIDGVTSYAGLRQTTNDLRLATGLATGWGLAALTVPMVNAQLWRRSGSGRVPEGAGQVLLWVAALVAAFGATRRLLPLAGVVYPLVTSAAIIVTFVAVNLVFVGLMPPFERAADRWRDAGLQLLIAALLTATEIIGAAALRIGLESLA